MLKMPRNRDEVDNMSIGAHRLLHRSCRGKAHASGIVKQNIHRSVSSQKSSKSSVRDDLAKQRESCISSNGLASGRKHSRNSTSSWEYSDSDSIHSSEIGQNGCMENRSINTNRDLDQSSSVKSDVKERIKGSCGSNRCSPLPRAVKNIKKENWVDTLRMGCIDDRIKRMEKGWNDSNVIRIPRERKWHRITAEIEQRIPNADNGLRMFGFKNNRTNNSKKISKRSRPVYQRCAKPIQDIIEWEELFEIALARKIKRKIRGKGTVDLNIIQNIKDGMESNRVKNEGECMKRLEVLLENRVKPQINEVRFAKNLQKRFRLLKFARSEKRQ